VKLHSTSITGFLLGGVAGRLGYKRFQETALVFNVSILFLLGVLHTRESRGPGYDRIPYDRIG
jgi:hypothetical protein